MAEYEGVDYDNLEQSADHKRYFHGSEGPFYMGVADALVDDTQTDPDDELPTDSTTTRAITTNDQVYLGRSATHGSEAVRRADTSSYALATSALRDLTTTGTSGVALLANSSSSSIYLLTTLIVKVFAITAISSVPTVSLGRTGPDYNDIIMDYDLIGISSTDHAWVLAPQGRMAVLNPGDSAYFNVVTGAVGTTLQAYAYLFGYVL